MTRSDELQATNKAITKLVSKPRIPFTQEKQYHDFENHSVNDKDPLESETQPS